MFVDGTHRTVTEDEGRKAMALFLMQRPFAVRGNAYAPHYVSAIKPMAVWFQEQEDVGNRNKKTFCKYGQFHAYDERCTCMSDGREAIPIEDRDTKYLPEDMKVKQLAAGSNGSNG